jgi:glycogen debranching enzyme
MQDQTITQTTYNKALENLLQNGSEHGLLASRAVQNLEKPPYDYLFPRDIGVCVIGMLKTGDDRLIALAKLSLETLIKSQSDKGQFPQSYRPDKDISEWWHPCTIDGSLWWPIAILEYVKKTGDTGFLEFAKERIDKAFTWLTYQDTNNDYLLEQGEAAGWDDEMPRHGTVLYTNALWYWFIKLRIEVEKREDLTDLKNRIYEGVNTWLWVHKADDHNHARDWFPENMYTQSNFYSYRLMEYINSQAVYVPYYLGYVSHLSFEMRCETYGNILACLVGLADEKKQQIITDYIFRSGTHMPYPVKAMYPPIYPGEPDWHNYMTKGRQNYPWQYHNGGIWPYIGGFWVTWLAQYDKEKAREQLIKLAEANALQNWEFNEYLHGQNGTPMGAAYQSWNMAMYMGAYQAVNG